MKYKKTLKRYEKNYLADDYSYYYKVAKDTIRDIKYLKEHCQRTQVNSYFDFQITPTKDNHIQGYLVREIFNKAYSYLIADEERVINIIKVLEITDKIVKMVREKTNDSNLNELKRWTPVFEYYTNGISLKENLGKFIGCNYTLNTILKKIEGNEVND